MAEDEPRIEGAMMQDDQRFSVVEDPDDPRFALLTWRHLHPGDALPPPLRGELAEIQMLAYCVGMCAANEVISQRRAMEVMRALQARKAEIEAEAARSAAEPERN